MYTITFSGLDINWLDGCHPTACRQLNQDLLNFRSRSRLNILVELGSAVLSRISPVIFHTRTKPTWFLLRGLHSSSRFPLCTVELGALFTGVAYTDNPMTNY